MSYTKSGQIADRRELLKIKFNALMFEAKIIRAAERKQLAYGKAKALPNPWLYEEMHKHRVLPLRHEARLTHLALGFNQGRSMLQMEASCKTRLSKEDWKRIGDMVVKYGAVAQVFAPVEQEPAEKVAA